MQHDVVQYFDSVLLFLTDRNQHKYLYSDSQPHIQLFFCKYWRLLLRSLPSRRNCYTNASLPQGQVVNDKALVDERLFFYSHNLSNPY